MRRGFSLVETLFSLTLIALILMVVLNLFPTTSMAMHRSREEQAANALAQSVLERSRTLAFSKLTVGQTEALGITTVDGMDYDVSREVYDPSGDPARLKGLRITVKWTGRKKIVHQVVQEGYVVPVPR